MDLPARQGRFGKALFGFAIANMCLRALFAFAFYWAGYLEMAVFSLIGVFVWLLVAALGNRGHQKAVFTLGLADLLVYSVVTTVVIGWQGGFFLLLLQAIPLNFYNTEIRRGTQLAYAILLIFTVLLLFSLTNMNILHSHISMGVCQSCFALNLAGTCITLALTGYLFQISHSAEEKERILSNQKMLMMANLDPLTDLMNRRIMMTRIEEEKERVDKGEKPFTLIMIDVDNFKQINDEYGHDGGDFVLINLARMINLCVRKTDLVSRWGGDEFLIMLPETPAHNGQQVADKMRNRITHSPFVYREMDIPVTVTLGVAQCDNLTGIGGSIRKADQALYEGKHAGKNRVVLTE